MLVKTVGELCQPSTVNTIARIIDLIQKCGENNVIDVLPGVIVGFSISILCLITLCLITLLTIFVVVVLVILFERFDGNFELVDVFIDLFNGLGSLHNVCMHSRHATIGWHPKRNSEANVLLAHIFH